VADHERSVVVVVHLPAKAGDGEVREHLYELGFQVTSHARSGKVQQ
jgi:hypothetical protein